MRTPGCAPAFLFRKGVCHGAAFSKQELSVLQGTDDHGVAARRQWSPCPHVRRLRPATGRSGEGLVGRRFGSGSDEAIDRRRMDHRLLTDALLASAPRGLAAGRCFEASNQALAVPQFHVTSAPYLLCSFDRLSVVCTLYKRVALDMTFVVEDVHSIIGHAILSPDFTSGLRAERSRNHSYGLNGIQISGSPRQQVIYDPDCPSLGWLEGEGRDPGRKNGYGNELPTAIRPISQRSRCSPSTVRRTENRSDLRRHGSSAPLNGQ